MRKSVYAAFALVMGSLLLSACNKNDDGTPVPNRPTVLHLSYKVPAASQAQQAEMRAPMTRAVDETAIHTVDVLSFKVDPTDPTNIKKGKFFYRARGIYTQTTPGEGNVQVTLLGAQEAQTLVVIANARSQVDMLGATIDEEKEAVMSRLTFDVATEASPDLTGGIPMWGELPNEIVGDNFSPSTSPKTVTMIRSVAKFTLVNPPKNDPNGKDFFYYYDQLRLYNYRSKGRVSPDNYNAADHKVYTPTVPLGARLPRATFTSLVIDPSNNFIYHGHEKSFYLCEVDNTVRPSGGNALDDLCLVVFVKAHAPSNHPEVKWDGYYRLDFKDYATDNPIDILRNHDYRIVVDKVEGFPAETHEEAFNGNYSLKCKIVPWNEVQEEVIVPANKRIKVDKGEVLLKGAASVTTGEKLTITTENTGGWKIDPTSIPAWVTISPTTSTTDGPTTITIKATQANSFNSAKLKLVGNNTNIITKLIRLTQLNKLPLEYVSEYNLAGGAQYGASPNNATPTAAQSDAALRWATSHNNDQSGYYNWYICNGIYDVNFNPNTKNLFSDAFFTTGAGRGYHLPRYGEWTGIIGYSGQAQYGTAVNYPNINEAVEIPGRRATFSNHYYSTGAPVPGLPADNRVCYALRYKAGTGNPIDGSSTLVFPLATNNKMACAFRYERVGGLNNSDNGNLTSHLKIQCVYVGDQDPLPDLQTVIASEDWWASQPADQVITRILPATGYIQQGRPSVPRPLYDRGNKSWHWTQEQYTALLAWNAYFFSNDTHMSANHKYNAFTVRLFSNQ